MNQITKWFEEVKQTNNVHTTSEGEFVIYKGFKITIPEQGNPRIQDVRFNTMYSDVTKAAKMLFVKLGFKRGVETLQNFRDIKRVEALKKKTAKLYDKRKQFRKELPLNKRLNEKRIRNIKRKVSENIDLIFFYQSRIKQFNNKYNGKN